MDKLSGSRSRALIQGPNPQKDSALESYLLHGTGRPNNMTFRRTKEHSRTPQRLVNQRCEKKKWRRITRVGMLECLPSHIKHHIK